MRTATGAVAMILAVLAVGACSGEDKKPDPEPPAKSSTKPPASSPSADLKVRYKDASLTLSHEDGALRCHSTSASFDSSSPEILKGGFAVESEPDVSLEPCGRNNEPAVDFSPTSTDLAFRATDQRDGLSCNATMDSGRAQDINEALSFDKLAVGDKFCLTHPYDQTERVELLRVQEISPKDAKVTFVVNAWKEKE
ncbi:hypothetical protein ACTWQF_10045 [Streptomyces sp. 8N114]|uniref:hypothetical protein n=1 Tax=Streptomyces sp. 8N114 TaxID=3457419 RepID=UPI003FCFA02E